MYSAEATNVLFHTWNCEERCFVLHLIFPHRGTTSAHLFFRIDLMPPPHSLLEIAASAISKRLPNEAMIQCLNIPNHLRPLIRACCLWNHRHVSL